MRYGVHENHGNYAITERINLGDRYEYIKVSNLSKREAAGLNAAAVPFFDPFGPKLPPVDPLRPVIVANPSRKYVGEPEWALMIGERLAARVNLNEAEMLEADGVADFDRSGHSPWRVRRENAVLMLSELREEQAETQRKIEEAEREIARLDEESAWSGHRAPLGDAAAEGERKAGYWAWLDARAPSGQGGEFLMRGLAEGAHWRRLTDAADADYEAREMRHSIGHSWGVYGAAGDVYSLRDARNAPQATVMAVNGVIVHAREHQNSRLSPDNQAEMEAFAQASGLVIRPDRLRFDVMIDDTLAAGNTRVTLLHRGPGGRKDFFTAVVSGRFSGTDAESLHEEFGPDPLTAPVIGASALPHGLLPEADGLDLELVSLRHTAEEAGPVSLDAFLDAMRGPDGPAP